MSRSALTTERRPTCVDLLWREPAVLDEGALGERERDVDRELVADSLPS